MIKPKDLTFFVSENKREWRYERTPVTAVLEISESGEALLLDGKDGFNINQVSKCKVDLARKIISKLYAEHVSAMRAIASLIESEEGKRKAEQIVRYISDEKKMIPNNLLNAMRDHK